MSGTCSNCAWGLAIVAGLRQLGVERFFLSPGARCAPLAAALRGHEVTVHYDERGMSFAALGCAMATGRPVACITTSGSAVANLLAACVEAFHSNVPLILVTADRPPELRGTGANQTIHQPGLFGGFVRFSVDLPTPQESNAPALLESALKRALECASGLQSGPVHLNVPFREPLLERDFEPLELGIKMPLSTPHEAEWPVGFDFLDFASARGVVVIGRLPAKDQSAIGAVVKLAARLGWPVIPDATSGARLLPETIHHADWILHRPDVPLPRRVLHFGGAIVSKRLGKWLSSCRGTDYLQVRVAPERLDPWNQNPVLIRSGIQEFCEQVAALQLSSYSSQWVDSWHRVDRQISCVLDRELEAEADLSEPEILRELAKSAVDAGCPLFLGNSMPIRDFDSCVSVESPQVVNVFANRGASGIDGNIATVAGIAAGCSSPLLAVMGDLAALHDINSLPLLREMPVTLVIINNGGGGIFRFLPLDVEERLMECPHGWNFRGVAEQFRIPYRSLSSLADLREALSVSLGRPCLLECHTDREKNHALHLRIAAACRSLSLAWVD